MILWIFIIFTWVSVNAQCFRGCTCRQLEIVCIYANITSIDTFDYRNLRDTVFLYLHNNLLRSISHSAFDNLPRLKALRLNNNLLQALHSRMFESLDELEELHLQNNRIVKLPNRGLFDSLTRLQILNLHGNKLKKVPRNIFNKLDSLEILNLSDNEIHILPEGLFDRLPSILELYLHDNKLNALPRRIFEKLTRLQRLRIDGNMFKCNCVIKDIILSLESLEVTFRGDGTPPDCTQSTYPPRKLVLTTTEIDAITCNRNLTSPSRKDSQNEHINTPSSEFPSKLNIITDTITDSQTTLFLSTTPTLRDTLLNERLEDSNTTQNDYSDSKRIWTTLSIVATVIGSCLAVAILTVVNVIYWRRKRTTQANNVYLGVIPESENPKKSIESRIPRILPETPVISPTSSADFCSDIDSAYAYAAINSNPDKVRRVNPETSIVHYCSNISKESEVNYENKGSASDGKLTNDEDYAKPDSADDDNGYCTIIDHTYKKDE